MFKTLKCNVSRREQQKGLKLLKEGKHRKSAPQSPWLFPCLCCLTGKERVQVDSGGSTRLIRQSGFLITRELENKEQSPREEEPQSGGIQEN